MPINIGERRVDDAKNGNWYKHFTASAKYWIERLSCFYLLTVRIWIGKVFIRSGLARLDTWMYGDWHSEIYLFTHEHPVPFLPPLVAAISALVFENLCSILIFIGLFTRLAVIPLFIMTTMIILTYDDNIQHYYWLFLFATLFFFGPGRISADHLYRLAR